MQYNSHLTLPAVGDYVVHGRFNYHSQTSTYQASAVNSLGLLVIYQGRWQNDETLVFTLVNPDDKGSSRVVYIKQPDGSIQMRSERLTADGDFGVYFETHMIREGFSPNTGMRSPFFGNITIFQWAVNIAFLLREIRSYCFSSSYQPGFQV